jgi:hypothetical protein
VPVTCEVIPNETIHHVEVQIIDRDECCDFHSHLTGATSDNVENETRDTLSLVPLTAVAVPASPIEHFDFIPTRTVDRGVSFLLLARGSSIRSIRSMSSDADSTSLTVREATTSGEEGHTTRSTPATTAAVTAGSSSDVADTTTDVRRPLQVVTAIPIPDSDIVINDSLP